MLYRVLISLLLWIPLLISPRALWVWQPGGSPDLISFAKKAHITDLFLQWSPTTERNGLRAFLKTARAEGIRVYALDGFPEAALAEHHAEVLQEVEEIASFNEHSLPEERYAGIQFDIEPYLLLGFDGGMKEQILSQYVELQARIAQTLHQHPKASLAYGVDLPFWFDAKALAGTLSFVDSIGIMDYRNRAEGPDGIVAHALPILEASKRAGKQVFIGVETSPMPSSRAVYLYGPTEKDWKEKTPATFPLLANSHFGKFRLTSISSDGRRYIGLGQPEEADARAEFQEALRRLQVLLGEVGNCSLLAEAARHSIAVSREYFNFQPYLLATTDTCPAGFSLDSKALPKITFAGQPQAAMEQELRKVEEQLRGNGAFAGIAIHDFTNYRLLRSAPF